MEPDVIEALIGVLGGLIGTLVGGLIAYLTLRTQLSHESKEKERERQLALRREVYLDAVEAIGKSQAFLSSFSREDLDIPTLLDKLEEVPGALNKAQLVTSEETFEALDRFGDFMVSSAVVLVGLRLRVRHFQDEIDDQNRQISYLEQRHDSVRAILQEVDQQHTLHAPGLEELDRVQQALASAHTLLQKLIQRHVELTEQLGRETLKAILGAQAEAGKVIIQIRKEIELPLREEWYLRRLEERKIRLLPKVDEAYKNVDQIFSETEAFEAPANPNPAADGQGRR